LQFLVRHLQQAYEAGKYGYIADIYYVVTYTPNVPTVTTSPATEIRSLAATLNGTLDSDGGEACEVRFQYGLTDVYGIVTPWQGGKQTGNTFLQAINGLKPNTTYHFCAQAKNSSGTSNGTDHTFTTKGSKGNINIDQLIYQHAERMESKR